MNEYICNNRSDVPVWHATTAHCYNTYFVITNRSVGRSHDLKALFWLKGALHKRAGHATRSSIGQLKHIVDEERHGRASLTIEICS